MEQGVGLKRIFRGLSVAPDLLPCSVCKEQKPKSSFRIRTDSKSKKDYYNSSCKKCDAKISREYYEKIKDSPDFKEKNRKRVKEYESKSFEEIRIRKDNPEYKKKKAAWEAGQYSRKSEQINARMKVRRQTPEYKAMMKEYRQRNKDKIREQEVVTKKRYHEKNSKPLTDKYVKHKLLAEGVKNPSKEQIEIKRGQILISRIKKHVRVKPFGIEKKCTMCGEVKDLVNFYPIKNKAPLSVTSICKECNSLKTKEYRQKKKDERKGSGEVNKRN